MYIYIPHAYSEAQTRDKELNAIAKITRHRLLALRHCIAVHGICHVPHPSSFPHERRKKDSHSLYLQYLQIKKLYSKRHRQKNIEIGWQWPHFNEYLTYFVIF